MGQECSSASLGAADEPPPLTRRESVLLANSTHYLREELQQLYKNFYRDITSISPDRNGIDFPLFCTTMTFLGVRSPLLHEMFFATFDRNRDGVITFDEFAATLSTMSRGTPEEKIGMTFEMYHCVSHYPNPAPRGSTPLLRRNGVLAVLRALESSLGGPNPNAAVHAMFNARDELTYEEFAVYAGQCPAVVESLALR